MMQLAKTLAPAGFALIAFGVFAVPSIGATAKAGTFNCAVVYDEFESLMNRQFLLHPGQFVRVQPSQISKVQFESLENAHFHLYPDRDGMGIGVLTTNQGVHAKFLFHWSQPMVNGITHVILDEIVKFGRVSDGYAPIRMGPFRLTPGMAIDIDTGKYIRRETLLIPKLGQKKKSENGDLKYETETGTLLLTAINGAKVEFPLESMCQQGSRSPTGIS